MRFGKSPELVLFPSLQCTAHLAETKKKDSENDIKRSFVSCVTK
jgi:hypothetical protein